MLAPFAEDVSSAQYGHVRHERVEWSVPSLSMKRAVEEKKKKVEERRHGGIYRDKAKVKGKRDATARNLPPTPLVTTIAHAEEGGRPKEQR